MTSKIQDFQDCKSRYNDVTSTFHVLVTFQQQTRVALVKNTDT